MSRKKKTFPNPQIDISFTKQNDNQVREDNRLNVEMLRVNATEKQRVMKDIWLMEQEQLVDFFTNYRLFPQSVLNMKQMLESTNLKLIKNANKIYFGQIERKKKSGKGICVYKEGKIYEGEFQENQRTGLGVEIYSNSNLYIGDFLNNKKHGKGQFFWFNLIPKAKESCERKIQYYDGEWWGGLPDGDGMHQKINGDLYMGTFKNGLKHGMGTQNFGNGDFYKGEYINGLPEGFGQYIWSDGSYYKGDFKQGLRSGYGFWSMNSKNSEEGYNEQYQGHYAMDKKSGYGVYQWQNGWTYKGNFQNDFRNGYGELYDREKCVYRGYWQNGEQTDSERPTGKLTSRTNASIHLSRGSTFARNSEYNLRNAQMDQQFYNTIQSGSVVPSRYKVEPKLTARPQFTIKKRPQSNAGLHKSEVKKRSVTSKKGSNTNQFNGTIGTSISRPVLKHNLYVPGVLSQRSRGY